MDVEVVKNMQIEVKVKSFNASHLELSQESNGCDNFTLLLVTNKLRVIVLGMNLKSKSPCKFFFVLLCVTKRGSKFHNTTQIFSQKLFKRGPDFK